MFKLTWATCLMFAILRIGKSVFRLLFETVLTCSTPAALRDLFALTISLAINESTLARSHTNALGKLVGICHVNPLLTLAILMTQRPTLRPRGCSSPSSSTWYLHWLYDAFERRAIEGALCR